MNHDLTDITVILDRSGSMHSIADDTLGGLNSFVEEQASLPGEAVFTLVQFDHEYEVVKDAVPIREDHRLTFSPRGGTALLDAIGRAINNTGRRLASQPESERPAKVVVAIITDGQENSSKEFARDQVFKMIEHQKEKYGWQFLFLGANQDAIAEAAKIGIGADQSLSFAGNAKGVNAVFSQTSALLSSYRSDVSNSGMAYSQADRDLQGGLMP